MSLRENQKMTEQGTGTGMDKSGTGNDNGIGIGNGLVELISPARSVNAENIIAANYQTVNQSIRIALNQRSLTHSTGTAAAAGRVTTLTPAELTISNTVRQGLTTDIHTATLDTLYKRYQTNLITGLTSDQVVKKHAEDGYNELTPPPQPSYIWLFCNQLIAGFNFILWIASVLFVLCWKPIGQLNGGKPDPTNAYVAIFLLLVILISAIFNTWQEIKSLIIVKSFSSMLPGHATVRRDGGIETQILARDLVLGDIVILKMGEKVPADIRIIGCEGLQVNNSSLTGEAEPVHSTTRCTSTNYMESLNLVFYSSLILQGSAIGVVVGIGDDTVLGQVSKLTQHGAGEVEDTSLHRQIRRFVWIITGIAITTGSICLIAWGAWLHQDHLDYMPVGSIIINAVSLIIAYVPEGLPVCVTLTLTLIAKRMYAQHVLVRNLAIIETFNSVSFIASDKTGTLTQNEMTVTEMVTGPGTRVWNIPTTINVQDDSVIEQYRIMKHDPIINKMLLGGILCNAARVQMDDDPDAEGAGAVNAIKKERIIGDAADTALYHLVTDHFGLSALSLRSSNAQLASLPFNSKNKLMITANQNDDDETAANTCSIYMKGAPEYILQYCRSTIDKDGKIIPLDAHARAMIAQAQEQLGTTGKRVIGLAVQTIPSVELKELAELEQNMNRPGDVSEDPGAASGGDIKHGGVRRTLEGFPADDYIFYGLFALMDPPRTEVPGAITAAHEAGIRVAMVTGDHPSTAAAIAKQVGILPAEASEAGIHTFSLGRDELHRMCVQISRHGQHVHTHVLGSNIIRTSTLKDKKHENKIKSIDVNKEQHVDGDLEMGIVPNSQAGTNRPISSGGGMSSMFEDHTTANQRTQSIRFHDIDEDVTSSVAEHLAHQDEVGHLIGLVDGFHDEWLLTPQYVDGRRVFLPYGVVVTGTDLNVFDDYMWAFVLSHQHIVFARTTPEQKLRIVQQAQDRDEIVAVTGDGTNDAPALKASDLGVAMASGTEVAREAGDLMLLDNNFASIISAIETGRVVADNLKKVCLYLLPASTWSEMWPVMANVFLGMPLPLYTFQMILLSVITDVFDAMALVHEKPERAIMKRPPVIPSQNKLVDWKLLYHAYIELGMICSLCGFFNFFWYMGDQGCGSDKIFFAWANWGSDGWCGTGDMLGSDQLEYQFTGQSIFFVSLVICNWFNMFSTRTRYTSILDHNPFYGHGQNLWLFVALVGTILVAIFVTQVSWFNTTFYTRPVPVKYVMPAFGFGAFMMLLDEVRKWNWRHRPNSLWAKMAW